ncbi:MAG: response regulator [Gemmatimonas sp.]|nr:response regulator [Gemmatimonas sp.]
MTQAEPSCAISVLVADDEELLAKSCEQILSEEGFDVSIEGRGGGAIEFVRRHRPDIVLADLKLPDMDGMDLLREIRQVSPDTLVVMVTGYATVDSSVEAMQAGAFDYIPKPFTATQLRVLIGRAAQQARLSRDNAALRDQLRRRSGATEIAGNSEAIRKVLSVVERIASTDASVFLSGESGTGKELVARALHSRSHRRRRPFIAINCAALPDQLLESELFGHEKGAFTGADCRREGLIASATGGTFFLDEITEMSLELQAKLLRVIQERQIRRVGGGKEVPIDVRWVSATNRDPEEAVQEGRLRQDLFFRLNVVPICMPPLRSRKDDITVLAQDFMGRYVTEYNRPGLKLSGRVLQELRDYTWPGNVRELQNVIERLVSLSSGDEISLEDLPGEWVQEQPRTANGNQRQITADRPFHEAKAAAIAAFEKAYLQDLLRSTGGNISQAARDAGIDRKTIHRMLSKHDLE